MRKKFSMTLTTNVNWQYVCVVQGTSSLRGIQCRLRKDYLHDNDKSYMSLTEKNPILRIIEILQVRIEKKRGFIPLIFLLMWRCHTGTIHVQVNKIISIVVMIVWNQETICRIQYLYQKMEAFAETNKHLFTEIRNSVLMHPMVLTHRCTQ